MAIDDGVSKIDRLLSAIPAELAKNRCPVKASIDVTIVRLAERHDVLLLARCVRPASHHVKMMAFEDRLIPLIQ